MVTTIVGIAGGALMFYLFGTCQYNKDRAILAVILMFTLPLILMIIDGPPSYN